MGGLEMRKYYKGDDFDSFGQQWAVIEVDIPEDWEVSRAELKVGVLPTFSFENPVFPLPFSLTAKESAKLKNVSTCHIALFDREGRKQTLEGSWTFEAENEVVGLEADKMYPYEGA